MSAGPSGGAPLSYAQPTLTDRTRPSPAPHPILPPLQTAADCTLFDLHCKEHWHAEHSGAGAKHH